MVRAWHVLVVSFAGGCVPEDGTSTTSTGDATSAVTTGGSGAHASTSTGGTVPTTAVEQTESSGGGQSEVKGEQMGDDPSCGDGVPVSGIYCFVREPVMLDGLERPLLVADFNGDAHVDLAAGLGSKVTIYMGDGLGGLAPEVSFIVPHEGSSWRALAGEFDGTPGTDIVAVGPHPEMQNVGIVVLMGNVGGTGQVFVPLAESIVPADFADVVAGAVFNLDGDGVDDLLGTTCCDAIAVQPLRNDGAGGFAATASPLLHGEFEPCLVLDLQPVPAVGDARAGNVAFGMSCNDDSPTGYPLYVVRPDGDGGVTYFEGPATGAIPRGLAVGDFDADGRADLVFSNRGDMAFAVYAGDALGSFGLLSVLPEAVVCPDCPCLGCGGSDLSRVFAPDLDGDGRADVVASDGATWVGMKVVSESVWGWLASKPLLAADFNEDGMTDFIAREPDNGLVLLRSDP